MQLKLTLYAKYFYKILNKEKTIEYRALTNYYENRFKKKYDTILFVNGYGNHRPFMIIELKEIKKTDKNYELYLGNILKIGNLKDKGLLFND